MINQVSIIDILIRGIAYTGIAIGFMMALIPLVRNMISKSTKRFRIKGKKVVKNKIIKHLELLLSITLNSRSDNSVLFFIGISAALFIAPLYVMLNAKNNFNHSLLIAFFSSIIPYLILLIKLHSIRIESSYEGENLTTELINQYKINYLNMKEAIDKTIQNLDSCPNTKKALSRLSWKLKQYEDEEDLNEIINGFVYSINTQWAMLLANNIYLSIEYDDDVRESLNDILDDLKDLRKLTESNNQKNIESYFMIKFFTPGIFLLSIIALFQFFGFTIQKYIDYQIKNPIGLRYFIICIFTIVLNIVIYYVTRKPKYDFD